MKGAREYANLFETGQYGRLYITSSSHGRGKTFRIQVLPAGEKAKSNGTQNLCTNENAVEVYGIVSGNPGWTETYGWLYAGSWQEDFQKIVQQKREELQAKKLRDEESRRKDEAAEKQRINELLSKY